ncbi:MAG TPA: BNR-4 repeat-containing protein [Pirellulales bacterium]|jgi:hypothetical protein|nr:BNR-4 repeat-containing protein [Pirellulales bacterium]
MRSRAAGIVFLLTSWLTFGSDLSADDSPRNLVVFNDNGAWCWYQDPRVVHDPENNTLLIASVAAFEGVDGDRRGGDVDIASYDLKSNDSWRFVLHHALLTQDDHNTPAVLIRPDGRYLAMYTRHNQDNFTYWRISTRPHDATHWRPERTFDWTPFLKTVDPKNHVTYSNLFYLSAEKQVYNFSRAVNTDPTILLSKDQGDSWSFGGKLLTSKRRGYVNGYPKYASNGVDRIDFVTTEHHPRDFNTSIYHGYIQGGKLHRTDGTVIDENVLDNEARPTTQLTKVFAAGSGLSAAALSHAWTVCLRRDREGGLFALITARANDEPENTNFSDHRLLYARLDGPRWRVTEIAKMGPRLWRAEEDYTGLGDIDGSDPSTVYISTPIDPRNGRSLKMHEIFKGVTGDRGQNWMWTAVTTDSPVDNLRPVVCPLGQGRRAVLWFRGTMSRSQHYQCSIVGVIE